MNINLFLRLGGRKQPFKMALAARFATLERSRPARGDFKKVGDSDVEKLKSIVGDVLEGEQDAGLYLRDWMDKYGPERGAPGQRSVVVRPRSTADLAAIMSYCSQERLAVVPQGGNTGLVGGSVPVYDEVVVSLGRMNAVESFDAESGVLRCEAGCVLQTLEEYVNEHGYTMPLDLGAKGSCQLGGNVATNAGGIRLLRYGSLHGSVLGLEVVMANGEVLDLMSPLRKDNTGYDLKQLFIGAEGTLGIISKILIATAPAPQAVGVALVACESFESAVQTMRRARAEVGEVLSAFEFMDRASMDLVLTHLPGARNPLPGETAPFFCLLETRGANREHDEAKLQQFLEQALEDGLVVNGTVAESAGHATELWRLREELPTAQQHAGRFYKYDLSLPHAAFYQLVEEMRARFAAAQFPGNPATVIGYGHLGDANLHLNILVPELRPEYLQLIEPFVYEFTAAHRGSISAEHGVGLMKPAYLHYSKSPLAINLMHSIKQSFDPQGILNPYKVLPI